MNNRYKLHNKVKLPRQHFLFLENCLINPAEDTYLLSIYYAGPHDREQTAAKDALITIEHITLCNMQKKQLT